MVSRTCTVVARSVCRRLEPSLEPRLEQSLEPLGLTTSLEPSLAPCSETVVIFFFYLRGLADGAADLF